MKSQSSNLLATFGLLALVTFLAVYLTGCGKKGDEKDKKKKRRGDYYYVDGRYIPRGADCSGGNLVDSAIGYTMSRHELELSFCAGQIDPRTQPRNGRYQDPRYLQGPTMSGSYSGPIAASGFLKLSDRINSSARTGGGWGGSFHFSFGSQQGHQQHRDPRYNDPRYNDPRYGGGYMDPYADPCYIPPGDYLLSTVVGPHGPAFWQNTGFAGLEMVATPINQGRVTGRNYGGIQLSVRTIGNQYENFIGGYYSGTKYLSANIEIVRTDSGQRCIPKRVYFGI